MKIQKFLFLQIENLKTKVKIKPDVAIILEIIKVATQLTLVERLASFISTLTRHHCSTLVWIHTKIYHGSLTVDAISSPGT